MTQQLGTYNLKINSFQAGFLLSHLWYDLDAQQKRAMNSVLRQLIDLQKQIRDAAGVTTEKLPDGTLKMTSADGVVLVRPPYEWEKEES